MLFKPHVFKANRNPVLCGHNSGKLLPTLGSISSICLNISMIGANGMSLSVSGNEQAPELDLDGRQRPVLLSSLSSFLQLS